MEYNFILPNSPAEIHIVFRKLPVSLLRFSQLISKRLVHISREPISEENSSCVVHIDCLLYKPTHRSLGNIPKERDRKSFSCFANALQYRYHSSCYFSINLRWAVKKFSSSATRDDSVYHTET